MADKKDRLSVFISLVLRHKPDVIGIKLGETGYANVDELIKGINDSGRYLDLNMLKDIVKYDNKNRYSFNDDFTKIRANQGHSVEVKVEMKQVVPPQYLYHGTSVENVDNIFINGVKKMNRLHVHLSDNTETALQVGKRHGKPIIIRVNAERMHADGYVFYLSENKVWLTDFVPNFYIEKFDAEL